MDTELNTDASVARVDAPSRAAEPPRRWRLQTLARLLLGVTAAAGAVYAVWWIANFRLKDRADSAIAVPATAPAPREADSPATLAGPLPILFDAASNRGKISVDVPLRSGAVLTLRGEFDGPAPLRPPPVRQPGPVARPVDPWVYLTLWDASVPEGLGLSDAHGELIVDGTVAIPIRVSGSRPGEALGVLSAGDLEMLAGARTVTARFLGTRSDVTPLGTGRVRAIVRDLRVSEWNAFEPETVLRTGTAVKR